MKVEKVYYRHYRYFQYDDFSTSPERYYRSGSMKHQFEPSTLGGKTECVAIISHGENTYELVATAVCNPKDRFCYKLGKELAYFRLQRILGYFEALETLVEEHV
jgi:hypothetical protein